MIYLKTMLNLTWLKVDSCGRANALRLVASVSTLSTLYSTQISGKFELKNVFLRFHEISEVFQAFNMFLWINIKARVKIAKKTS